MCYNLCTNLGRYCATDPDGDLDVGISGAHVVMESMRWLCVWEVARREDQSAPLWWEYVAIFLDQCSGPEQFTNEACAESAMKQAGINLDEVSECYQGHPLDGDERNKLLEEQIYLKKEIDISTIPSLLVNRQL